MKVFFDKRQSVKGNSSFSPSAGKPVEVLKSWLDLGLPIEIGKVKPISEKGLGLAHDPSYVRGVLGLSRSNGFGNQSKEVAASLHWTSGSLYSAAEYVVKNGGAAASLTSGFHHAGYSHGGGFCTFNGLMVTALVFKELGLVEKVGVLDIDMHYGNGTDDIIRKLELDWVKHWTFGSQRNSDSEEWLKELPKIVESFSDCDVILYQAGADPHILDPLGGVLTTEQMRRRDEIVFKTAKKMGVPIAWNLAGGYQDPLRKVLNLHDNTAIECVKVFETLNSKIKSHEASQEEINKINHKARFKYDWSDFEIEEEVEEEESNFDWGEVDIEPEEVISEPWSDWDYSSDDPSMVNSAIKSWYKKKRKAG